MKQKRSLRGVHFVLSVEDSTWALGELPECLEIVINLAADKNGYTHHFHELLSYN